MVPLVLVLLLFGVLVVVKKRACSELAPRFRPHLVLKFSINHSHPRPVITIPHGSIP